jgi:hypothetical protein
MEYYSVERSRQSASVHVVVMFGSHQDRVRGLLLAEGNESGYSTRISGCRNLGLRTPNSKFQVAIDKKKYVRSAYLLPKDH